jgi:glycerol-3-phosphate dehydrogenase (NAD(P)+)
MSERIAVLGAGAWGTALAIAAARNGHRVALWARDPARAAEIAATRRNARLLPEAVLPDSVAVTADARAALAGASLALLAVPAQAIRAVVAAWPAPPALLVCAKGVEAATLRLPLEICAERWPDAALGVLTGPNFAHEIAAGLPAATLAASADAGLRERALALLNGARLRVYAGDDPIGAQVGGAAKNVIAIAAGAVIGAGLGENARAALVTRGLAEIARLALALGGRAETVAGLSGLGDLLLTCTGAGSRNFSLGAALGRGEALADVLSARSGVTEGVATAPALLARADAAGVDMPVAAGVVALLGGQPLAQAMEALLIRPPRAE